MSWEDTQRSLAQGLGWLRARETSLGAGSMTMGQALLEAIVELDSAQSDALETLGAGGLVQYTDDGQVRLGQLQRIEQMRAHFLGDSSTGQVGLLDAIRDSEDPSLAEGPAL